MGIILHFFRTKTSLESCHYHSTRRHKMSPGSWLLFVLFFRRGCSLAEDTEDTCKSFLSLTDLVTSERLVGNLVKTGSLADHASSLKCYPMEGGQETSGSL